ncbi:hypothetical protein F5X99DRAFT_413783 [Biscogniauxia marginata]|nr:hypothetical protein F5X99DRAFT_413783 [Biscogniauxia marginata]
MTTVVRPEAAVAQHSRCKYRSNVAHSEALEQLGTNPVPQCRRLAIFRVKSANVQYCGTDRIGLDGKKVHVVLSTFVEVGSMIIYRIPPIPPRNRTPEPNKLQEPARSSQTGDLATSIVRANIFPTPSSWTNLKSIKIGPPIISVVPSCLYKDTKTKTETKTKTKTKAITKAIVRQLVTRPPGLSTGGSKAKHRLFAPTKTIALT